MHFRLYENDDEDAVFELDGEAIEYFIDGLQRLLLEDPGEELITPSLVENDGNLAVGSMVIKRMEDVSN